MQDGGGSRMNIQDYYILVKCLEMALTRLMINPSRTKSDDHIRLFFFAASSILNPINTMPAGDVTGYSCPHALSSERNGPNVNLVARSVTRNSPGCSGCSQAGSSAIQLSG